MLLSHVLIMPTSSKETMVTVAILEDLIDAKKIDKASIKLVIKTLRSQITDMETAAPERG